MRSRVLPFTRRRKPSVWAAIDRRNDITRLGCRNGVYCNKRKRSFFCAFQALKTPAQILCCFERFCDHRRYDHWICPHIDERPQLRRMPDGLREGDAVVVAKYDWLGRSLIDLLPIVETIRNAGADSRSLAEDIDTTTSVGRLIFHVFRSIAEFERERISERTKEGLAAARKRGRVGGRPRALTSAQEDEARAQLENGRSAREVASIFNVSRATIQRLR